MKKRDISTEEFLESHLKFLSSGLIKKRVIWTELLEFHVSGLSDLHFYI